MDDDRLPTHLWVMAGVRRCNAEGRPAMVVHKGERTGGTVALKVNRFAEGCTVLTQMRDLDGAMGWMDVFQGKPTEEAEADAYLTRAVARDPDLWVIEIESPDGSHPFDGKVL